MPQMPVLVAIYCIVQILLASSPCHSVILSICQTLTRHTTPDTLHLIRRHILSHDTHHHHYLDLGHHVAGDKAGPGARLAPVEAVRVLLPEHLDQLALPEGQLLVARVGVG